MSIAHTPSPQAGPLSHTPAWPGLRVMEHPGGLRWGAAPRLASPGVRSGSGSALGKPPAHLSPGAEILPPVRPGRAAGPRAGSPGMRPSGEVGMRAGSAAKQQLAGALGWGSASSLSPRKGEASRGRKGGFPAPWCVTTAFPLPFFFSFILVSPSDARREISGIHAQFQSNSVRRQRENYEWMLPSDEEVDWGGLCARRAPSKQGHWPLHCFNAAG